MSEIDGKLPKMAKSTLAIEVDRLTKTVLYSLDKCNTYWE